jgi:hypothetical protein
MDRNRIVVSLAVVLVSCGTLIAEKAPEKVGAIATGSLAKIASSPAVVAAVKAQNAKGLSMAAIKEMDQKWMGTAGVADFMKALMDNDCGKFLKQAQADQPYLVEVFVTDNQGANVCQTGKTSDYWQGDEEKFTAAWKDGAGANLVGDVAFDKSAQTYVSQVSVPVKDGGKAIGVAVFGVDVAKLK